MPMISKATRNKWADTERLEKRGMPPGLAAYHAAKRAAKKKAAKKKRARKKNPMRADVLRKHISASQPRFALQIRKGNSRLIYDGEHFSSKPKRVKRYHTLTDAQRAGQSLMNKFASVLKGWKFYAVERD